MSAGSDLTPERIAEQGRDELRRRLRSAFDDQLALRPPSVSLSEGQVQQLVDVAAGRAGGVLWRRCLAGVAADALGIALGEAVTHPKVLRAHQLAGAPPYEAEDGPEGQAAEPETGALRVAAVHLSGIESLRRGESDLELRFSSAGLDVLKASSGAAIGRLTWSEIENVSFAKPRRGLRAGRHQQLHVQTTRGRALFELPGLSDRQLAQDLEPLLARWRPPER